MSIGNKWTHKPKHVISIGGGVASTLELPLHVIDQYGADNVDMFICALRGESPDLWRMVDWIEDKTGKHVTRVAWTPYERSIYHGLRRNYWIDAPQWAWSDIWTVFFKVRMMGNTRLDPCSDRLKRKTAIQYLLDHYDPANTTVHFGITGNEEDRMIRIGGFYRDYGFKPAAPLIDLDLKGSSLERAEKILGWKPELYAWGASHNNCGGFCIKSGHKQMALFLKNQPKRYAYHEAQEQRFQREIGTTATIMRDRVTKYRMVEKENNPSRLPMFDVDAPATITVEESFIESIPLSLKEFRERMEVRWSAMQTLEDAYDGLEETPACTWCGIV